MILTARNLLLNANEIVVRLVRILGWKQMTDMLIPVGVQAAVVQW